MQPEVRPVVASQNVHTVPQTTQTYRRERTLSPRFCSYGDSLHAYDRLEGRAFFEGRVGAWLHSEFLDSMTTTRLHMGSVMVLEEVGRSVQTPSIRREYGGTCFSRARLIEA